ncbi:Activator of Hsp90 ATPase 1 family protein [Kribbella flavida DSM 17836]|uniref:Activator of Hsp90 ATPase 1 family protein n=1 Tax=Kribbella flavida (strain DSM 17836 / JCM 10339 / NBRC 14399) TaxID=479435 RepID=D2PMR8_KRIFD|nr:SRPBCC family protein [Kribbella flavida]ADB32620.1 Activator of Hsp90 ATPase 1 family protein [Kribbella flavida DSM 17836]
MSETLTTENGRTVLRMERRLAHPPEKVWRALTDPAELAHWYPALVEADLRLDGRIVFTFADGEDDFVDDPDNTGVIRAYDPPRLLEFTWGSEVQRWEVTPTAEGCVLALTSTYDDRASSASLTSGWILCLDALDKALGGSAVPREHYSVLHEHFVKQFGLDDGELRDDGSLRFERQLTAPKEEVWSRLAGGAEPAAGSLPPVGFVAKGIDPGPATEAAEPARLSYPWQHGTVTWKLRDGNGGARLVVTLTGPAAEHRAAWRELIESLAAEVVTRS